MATVGTFVITWKIFSKHLCAFFHWYQWITGCLECFRVKNPQNLWFENSQNTVLSFLLLLQITTNLVARRYTSLLPCSLCVRSLTEVSVPPNQSISRAVYLSAGSGGRTCTSMTFPAFRGCLDSLAGGPFCNISSSWWSLLSLHYSPVFRFLF